MRARRERASRDLRGSGGERSVDRSGHRPGRAAGPHNLGRPNGGRPRRSRCAERGTAIRANMRSCSCSAHPAAPGRVERPGPSRRASRSRAPPAASRAMSASPRCASCRPGTRGTRAFRPGAPTVTRPPKLSLRDLAKPPPTAAPATPQELAREAQPHPGPAAGVGTRSPGRPRAEKCGPAAQTARRVEPAPAARQT